MRAFITSFFIAATLVGSSAAWAEVQSPAGKITHLSGTLSAKLADGTSKLLGVQSDVFPGDTLNTANDTYARIRFQDGGEVVLRPHTQFRIDKYSYSDTKPEGDTMLVSLLKGGIRAVTGLLGKRNPEKVNVNTATATIGIRGTHFGLLYCSNDCSNIPSITGQPPANGLHIDVAQGAVLVSNSAGSQQFTAGQYAFVPNAFTPPMPNPQPIQVTMPSTISQNNTRGNTLGNAGQNPTCAISN